VYTFCKIVLILCFRNPCSFRRKKKFAMLLDKTNKILQHKLSIIGASNELIEWRHNFSQCDCSDTTSCRKLNLGVQVQFHVIYFSSKVVFEGIHSKKVDRRIYSEKLDKEWC